MEHFVENDDHILADYQFRCRVCLIKLEIGESSKISVEDKAHFLAITGLKLRSNRNFSKSICSMCRRDLFYSFYFKEKAKKIQIYLNHKGEDCINGSDSDEEAVVLEGYPTFVLNDSEEYELHESLNEETVQNEYEEELPKLLTEASGQIETQFMKEILDKSNEDLMIDAPYSAPIPSKINKGCEKNPGPLKAYQYKPSIVNYVQKKEKKKVNEDDMVRKMDKPNKLILKEKEKHESQNNTKKVSIDTSHIQSPEKVLKKGFPAISSRRQSIRVINKELMQEKPAILAPQVQIKRKTKMKIVPMQTRSKTIPEGPKKVIPFDLMDWMAKPKKVIPKYLKGNATPGIFICPAPCYRIFSYNYNLIRHQQEFHSELKTPTKLTDKIVKKSPIKPHQCQICMKFYETPTLLNNHELSVHNKKRYCKYRDCKQFFYTKFNLKFHVAIHIGFDCNNNIKNICEFCGLMNEENVIKRHKLTHMNPKFQCSICKQTFRLLKSLENHIKSVHNFTETKINKTFGGIRNRGRKNSII